MALIFANNAVSKLAQPLLLSQTTLTVQPGTGALFPSPSGGDYFKLTIEDRRTQQIEVTHCTGRSGDVLTVVRGQEDMTALDFLIGATVSNRFTRDTPDAILAAVPNVNPWYLGPFASPPLTDNDGNVLQAGMSYFNTSDTHLYYWTGASWLDPIGSGSITSASGVFVLQNIASGFNGSAISFNLRYTDYAAVTQTPDVTIAEQFIVWIDGVAQQPGTDFIISGIGTIEFLVAPPADAIFHGIWIALTNGLPGAGTGDMTRAVYDVNNDGVVDAASTVQFGGISSVPTQRFIGRLTAGTGTAEALSKAQMQVALDVLDKTGDTMSGDLDMDGNTVDNPDLRDFGITSPTTPIVAGVLTLDFADGNARYVLVGEDITSIVITGWKPSGVLSKMTVVLENGGGFGITWPSSPENWYWSNGAVPVFTPTSGKRDVLVAMSVDGGATIFPVMASQNH